MNKSFKSLLKARAARFGTCAYLYRNGVALTWTEEYKGKHVYFSAFHACEIRFSDERLTRIVLHNSSLLLLGIPDTVKGYPNNKSEHMERMGITCKTIVLGYASGAEIRIDCFDFLSADVAPQGDGPWYSPFSSGMNREYQPQHDDLICA